MRFPYIGTAPKLSKVYFICRRPSHKIVDLDAQTISTGAISAAGLEREVSRLYGDNGAALLHYATSVCRDPELARDAVQEGFLRYFVERRYGASIENPRAWLYRVVRNYAVDLLKAAARTESLATGIHVPDQSGHNPETEAGRKQLAMRLEGELTARELDCFRLRAAGSEYREIAETLGVRPGTVGAMLAHAQKKLRSAGKQLRLLLEET